MQVTEVKYARRFNLGDYEHEEIHVTASVEDGEDVSVVLGQLKTTVQSAQAGEPEAKKEVSKKETVKKSAKKQKQEEPKETEEQAPQVEATPEVSKPEDGAPVSKKKTGKKFRSKAATYSRNEELHKKLFVEAMGEINPRWNKDAELAKKAKAASMELDGESFLDDNGEVLSSFKLRLKKLVG